MRNSKGLPRRRRSIFGDHFEDDVLTYALFPQVGLKFFEHRNDSVGLRARPDTR